MKHIDKTNGPVHIFAGYVQGRQLQTILRATMLPFCRSEQAI
jgi:hypothetical protein